MNDRLEIATLLAAGMSSQYGLPDRASCDPLLQAADMLIAAELASRKPGVEEAKDTARLDWFEQEAPVVLVVDDKWEVEWNISDDGEICQHANGPTLRAAIDAAQGKPVAQGKEGV